MLVYKALEHSDNFETTVLYWVDVTGVPEPFINEAKQIDGDNYNEDCFGVCLQYNQDTDEYLVIEDAPGCQLYYIDNDGDKHWMAYEVSKEEETLFFQKVKAE